MSKTTQIQWTDSTVNPDMGCDGCECNPPISALRKQFADALAEKFLQLTKAEAQIIANDASRKIRVGTQLYQARMEVIQKALTIIGKKLGEPFSVAERRKLALSMTPTCYAAILHARRGADPRNPDKGLNRGYAPVFEEPKLFPGRMAEAAKYSDLCGTERPDSPWKNGLPRMIFISDMGDALSKIASFDFLKNKIIDAVVSENGSRHIWQWLTKRSGRMAKFGHWLGEQDIPWPQILVAMTSVTSMKTAARVAQLQHVPTAIRGLSVEPLWGPVRLNLQGIDWVIVGGESGPAAKPFDLAWARSLRDPGKRPSCFTKNATPAAWLPQPFKLTFGPLDHENFIFN